MIKLLVLSVFMVLGTIGYTQQMSFPVSPQLTVTLPFRPDSSESNGLNIYSLNNDSVFYQIAADSKKLRIGSSKDFETGFNGVYHGYEKKLSDCFIQKSDTTIGEIKGEFVFAVSKDSSESARQLFMFYTIVDGHIHVMQCATSTKRPAMESVQQFFTSARFNGENYPMPDTYAMAEKIGEVMGYVIMLGMGFILFTLVRRGIVKLRKRRS